MANDTYRPTPSGESDYPLDIRLYFQRGVDALKLDKYGKDGGPILMCETLQGILRVSHSGVGQYGPWNNARVETDQPGEWQGKEITIWGGWREKSDRPNQLYQVIKHAWDEWGSGARVLFRRLPDEDREHCYEVVRLDESASASQGNGGKPTTATGWTELYRQQFDNFPASEKRNANLEKIVATAATDGFSFIHDELRFVSVTADDAGDEPDDLPF